MESVVNLKLEMNTSLQIDQIVFHVLGPQTTVDHDDASFLNVETSHDERRQVVRLLQERVIVERKPGGRKELDADNVGNVSGVLR